MFMHRYGDISRNCVHFCFSHLKVVPRPYGARIELLISAPEYCHCDDPSCKEKKYLILDSVIRVKRDGDLVLLSSYLESLTHVWKEKIPVDDSDSEQ